MCGDCLPTNPARGKALQDFVDYLTIYPAAEYSSASENARLGNCATAVRLAACDARKLSAH